MATGLEKLAGQGVSVEGGRQLQLQLKEAAESIRD